ncbi:MAG: CHAP domain-containing protein [Actinomycetales bacterium]|uniref:CHAP domain-containing protein n=1 Tax=Candidatus Phosphoribacter hodrii TaxID=2953743 RepID=A0A934X6I4_9MICO|nr:CHAP domain-containing protein [Candidatus Phosphoribacter hodrii]
MTRLGMDVDVVEGLGRQLKGQAHQLQGVVTQIESLVNQSSTAWDGKDSQDFRQWWRGEHKPKLVSLQQMIDGLGTSALNNAQEQRGTSGGSVSGHSSGGTASPSTPGLATPSPGPGGNHAAPDAVPGAAPAGTGGAAIAAKDFAAKWAGKYLDYDHAYGNQCFDVFAQYNHDIVGGRDVHAATTGGAKDLYNDYATNGAAARYDRVPGSERPAAGDVVVWGNGTYGHVGVVTGTTDSGYTVLEQNTDARASSGSAGALPKEVTHRFGESTLLGYLRPKI